MEIFNNSIWKIDNFEGLTTGLYRVIKIFDEISCLVIFYLENNQGLSRPIAIDLQQFNLGIRQKVISKGEFKLPPHLFFSEEEID